MKATPTITKTERAGRWLGRMWHGVARRETRAIHWLAAKGLPAGVGRLLLWGLKFGVLGALLITGFWIVGFLLVGTLVVWAALNSNDASEAEPEWREGHSGFGLYDKNEWRHDMGDPEDP